MTEIPRRRAIINGLYVVFESKNTDGGKYHGRFKQRYRSKADALAAKDAWEKRGRITFPGDFATPKPAKPASVRRMSVPGGQQEARL